MERRAVEKYLESLTRFGVHLGLGRVRELLGALGDPHKAFPAVHVTGTNGKGSVSRMIASILEEAGYRTGLYMSPHLERFNERISVNGKDIPDGELATLTGKVKKVVDRMAAKKRQCTYFEATTAIAFEYFRKQKVDIAVVEVGMGGRLDATNLVEPLVSVITNISLEHTDVLGATLERIAFEKAGIIKKGVPVATAVWEPKVLDIIRGVAKAKRAPVFMMQREVRRRPLSQNLEGQRFSIYTDEDPYRDIGCRMPGEFQLDNAALAILAVELVAGLQGQKGYVCYGVSPKSGPLKSGGGLGRALHLKKPGISADIIKRGLERARLPGRMEFVREGPHYLLDSAHNPAAAERAAREVAALAKGGFRHIHLLFGNLLDKDFAGVLVPLLRISETLTFVQSSSPRSLTVEEAEYLIRRMEKRTSGKLKAKLRNARYYDDVRTGVLNLMSRDVRDLILISGSMYAVGEARSFLRARKALK
jgi:dihydrofolate synthase/folylpolyglutamate synthase